jgi:hypothetical protein
MSNVAEDQTTTQGASSQPVHKQDDRKTASHANLDREMGDVKRYERVEKEAPFKRFKKMAGEWSKKQTSLLIQLRTGHAGLNAHLYRFKRVESPICEHCAIDDYNANETVQHYLFECPAWTNQRRKLQYGMGHHKAKTMKGLFENEENVKQLIKFVASTRRFEKMLGDVSYFPKSLDKSND